MPHFNVSKARALMLPLLLASALTMGACQMNSTYRLAGETDRQVAARLCREGWLPVRYNSKRDDPRTIEDARANNRAWKAYCQTELGVR